MTLKNINFTVFQEDVDIDNILIFEKISLGGKNRKYFINYMDEYYKIRPFCMILPKTNACVKCYHNETKWIYFLTEDHELSEKYGI